jgi:hypothetical protein
MLAVPAVNPDTVPVVAFTLATGMLLLLHEPPAGVLASVSLDPAQIVKVPVIVVGVWFTVTMCVAAALPQATVTV